MWLLIVPLALFGMCDMVVVVHARFVSVFWHAVQRLILWTCPRPKVLDGADIKPVIVKDIAQILAIVLYKLFVVARAPFRK